MTTSQSTDSEIRRISQVLGRLRVLIGRRLIGRAAIANIAPGTDLSYMDVLSVIPPTSDDPRETPGTSVGAVAQAMRIDPSRASRLVSQMVDQGFLARVASPSDGRSSLVVRTDLGQRLHLEIREVKRRVITEALEGWTPEEIASFAALFDRFINSWEERLAAGEPDDGQR
jgi:DNA-binding MarR family transcriptional regulator